MLAQRRTTDRLPAPLRGALASAAVVCATLASGTAWAVPAILIEDNRISGIYGDNCDWRTEECTHFSQTSTPPSPFAGVDPLSLGGSGSGSGASNLGWSTSWTTYDIVFDLDAHTQATLAGEIELDGYGIASVSLDLDDSPLHSWSLDWAGYDSFLIDTILAPGRYRLTARAQGYADPYGTYARYDVSLALSPEVAVPEPGTALLVGLGLAGLAASRRPRRSRPETTTLPL